MKYQQYAKKMDSNNNNNNDDDDNLTTTNSSNSDVDDDDNNNKILFDNSVLAYQCAKSTAKWTIRETAHHTDTGQ